MNRVRVARVLCFAAVVAIVGVWLVDSRRSGEWAALAKADVQAAYQQMLDNHPGVVDPRNPEFLVQLQLARDHGLGLARKADSLEAYGFVLAGFTAVLQDGHAGAFAQPTQARRASRWPGFVGAWRGDSLFVYRSLPEGPPPGARLLGCDGTLLRELVLQNVFTFHGRSAEQGQWWLWAPSLFWDTGNPLVDLPSRCTFEIEGRSETRKLTWREVSEEARAWRKEALYGERLPIGLTEPRPGMFWIALPDFQPDAAGRTAYQVLHETLFARRAELLAARALVLDLRHNQGGSSNWSFDIAGVLWGTDAVASRIAEYLDGVRVWWRASTANADYMERAAGDLIQQADVSGADNWLRIAESMREQLTQGKNFVIEPFDSALVEQPGPQPTDFTRPVYVIVPGQCASACLDALDIFTRFSNVKLIGAPSSADTKYLETREQPLPSKRGQVVIPIKIWMGRPRASGEFYTPQIPVDDLVWSTANFIARIEGDLGK